MPDIALRPSYWASVSGGKDSLYMMKVILENPEKYPLNGVVHYELEIDYPFIKDVTSLIEQMCQQIGVPFYRFKPRMSWYDLYQKYGFPSHNTRWCNKPYKMDGDKQLREFLQTKGLYPILYIGYCADEGTRFSHRDDRTEVYPLAVESIQESYILEWAKGQPVFNNYYAYNRRCGCMFCPMQSRMEMAYLLRYYPEKYSQMISMAKKTESERSNKLGRPVSVWSSNPKYNTSYMDTIIRTKWLPKLLAIERDVQNQT